MPPRNPYTNKYDYGHALLIAGSYGKMGAALLATKACLLLIFLDLSTFFKNGQQ